jgi:myo-inositol-1(or 4)-monophosphatase
MYKKEFELAKEVSIKVGKFLKTKTVKAIESQIGKDIKLELDKKSEDMIITALNEEFSYPILSEEIGLTKKLESNKPYWIIDPIDGTLNFSRDNPTCCISIAFWIDKKPIFGIIYDFSRDELFSGYLGYGAWLNDELIKKSVKKEKSQAILATGFPTYMNTDKNTLSEFISQIQEYKKIRMIGSAALSLAYVACGRFDCYMEQNIKLWDVAAGIAINSVVQNNIDVKYLDNYITDVTIEVVFQGIIDE